jgi:hypothetical protein
VIRFCLSFLFSLYLFYYLFLFVEMPVYFLVEEDPGDGEVIQVHDEANERQNSGATERTRLSAVLLHLPTALGERAQPRNHSEEHWRLAYCATRLGDLDSWPCCVNELVIPCPVIRYSAVLYYYESYDELLLV